VRRREFIAGLGGAVAWPLAVRAQHGLIQVIGYLSVLTEDVDRPLSSAFRRGLGEHGYVEGRNVEILYRYSARGDRLRDIVEELVHSRISAIYMAGGPAGMEAVRSASETVPIVFVTGTDPVESGLVASLNRRGGNVTGIYYRGQELTAKRLELLHETLPEVTRVGFLHGNDAAVQQAEAAARTLGVKLTRLKANGPGDIEAALAMFVERQIGALAVSFDGLFAVQAPQILAWTARHRVPAIYPFRVIADAGGLMSYGTDVADAWRIAGTYTGRVLKGEKPADLPVQLSTRIEMVLNLKTAKALGLSIPPSILAIADEVIE
jgi:putative tryptophan/tyrosine transport system substrate-binding protein